jgi:hypothetical protein
MKKKASKNGAFLLAAPGAVFELLKAYRSEVVAIKEQLRFVRERLAA